MADHDRTEEIARRMINKEKRELIDKLLEDILGEGKRELWKSLQNSLSKQIESEEDKYSRGNLYTYVIKKKVFEDTYLIRFNLKSGTGNGKNKMKNYHWIPVIAEVEKNNKSLSTEYYTVNLVIQDMDTDTGNVHVHLNGEIQIFHNLLNFEKAEFGGEIRPEPVKAEEGDLAELKEKYEADFDYYDDRNGVYKTFFNPYNAYPVAKLKQSSSDRNKPWGMTLKEIGVEAIPSMDLCDPGYDADKLADFIVALILADIRKKYA